jgi:hypothetical protein
MQPHRLGFLGPERSGQLEFLSHESEKPVYRPPSEDIDRLECLKG